MFKGMNGEKTFNLMQCWNILKDEEKWKAKRRKLAELMLIGTGRLHGILRKKKKFNYTTQVHKSDFERMENCL